MTVWYGVANGADFSIAEKKSARAGIDLATVRDPRAWVEIADPSLIGVFDRNTMRYALRNAAIVPAEKPRRSSPTTLRPIGLRGCPAARV